MAVLKSFSFTRAEDKGALSLKALLDFIPSTRFAFQVPLHLLPMLEKADIITLWNHKGNPGCLCTEVSQTIWSSAPQNLAEKTPQPNLQLICAQVTPTAQAALALVAASLSCFALSEAPSLLSRVSMFSLCKSCGLLTTALGSPSDASLGNSWQKLTMRGCSTSQQAPTAQSSLLKRLPQSLPPPS